MIHLKFFLFFSFFPSRQNGTTNSTRSRRAHALYTITNRLCRVHCLCTHPCTHNMLYCERSYLGTDLTVHRHTHAHTEITTNTITAYYIPNLALIYQRSLCGLGDVARITGLRPKTYLGTGGGVGRREETSGISIPFGRAEKCKLVK